MNLNEIVNYTGKQDKATVWAVYYEFRLRYSRYRRVVA